MTSIKVKFPKSWRASSRFSLHYFSVYLPRVFHLSSWRWWWHFCAKKKKKRKHTRRKVNMGAKTLGGITKVIKSYEGRSLWENNIQRADQPYFTVLRCFDTVFQRPYRYFSIALKVFFSLSNRYKIFIKNWLWIEIYENIVLSKIDITMTTIKKLWNW